MGIIVNPADSNAGDRQVYPDATSVNIDEHGFLHVIGADGELGAWHRDKWLDYRQTEG